MPYSKALKKIAFFSVIYPQAEPYFECFFRSLEAQSHQNFDLVIINDGISEPEIYQQKYPGLSIIFLNFSGSVAKIREYGINYLIRHHYDAVVFGDSDDYFSPKRIETSLQLLQRYDVVANDVTLVSKEEAILQNTFFSKSCANLSELHLEDIVDKNIFGLSNTALRLTNLSPITFDDNLIAVDWHFYSLLLLQGKSSCFTNNALTYYRQYDLNTAKLNKTDLETLKKGFEVKLIHYRLLSPLAKIFKQRFDYFKTIDENDDLKNSYLLTCQKKYSPNRWWWENLRSDFVLNP